MHRTRLQGTVSGIVAVALVLLLIVVPGTNGARAAGTAHLSRYRVAAGDTFNITGGGFAAGDEAVATVDFQVGKSTQRVAAIAGVDGSGNFAASLIVPRGTNQGTYAVTARDYHGNVAIQQVAVLPVAYLQAGSAHNAYVLGNHEFYASGAGFGNGENITITASFPLYNGSTTQVTHAATSDKAGHFGEVLFAVPRGARPGKATIAASGQNSGRKASDTVYVTYRPSITLASNAVRPGAAVVVSGADFVPGSTVSVSFVIPRSNGSSVTFSRSIVANGDGSLKTAVTLPSDLQPGTYTITAADTTGNFKAYAHVTVSIHPVLTVAPGSAFAGQVLLLKGSGFGNHVGITVSATFPISGGHQYVHSNTTSNGTDTFSTQLVIPGNATAGKVTLTAAGGHGKAYASVQVLQKPAPKPTSTPVPPTATPVPATAVPQPTNPPTNGGTSHGKHGKHGLRFTYLSVWYHPIRVGSYEHVIIHVNPKKTIGIWMHVYFPSGQQLAFYENTDPHGQWTKVFRIPVNAYRHGSNVTLLTIQLWKGHTTVKEFYRFNLIR